MKISVIIPTAARHEFLRTALQSVATQTALEHVEEILVSENLGDRRSETVCAEFPHLPIRYIFRDPQLPFPLHISVLARETRGDLVALLNDDDWWSPGHLETGRQALEQDPTAVAWFAASLWQLDESATEASIDLTPELRLLRPPGSKLIDTWQFDEHAMIVLGWAHTAFHWSTVIAHREAIIVGTEEYDTIHGWYPDRLLITTMAGLGNILFQPSPTTFVRLHEGTWASDPEKVAQLETADQQWKKRITALAESKNIDLLAEWKKIIPQMNEAEIKKLHLPFIRYHTNAELAAMGLEMLMEQPQQKTLRDHIKTTSEWLIPPALAKKIIALKRR